MKEYTIQSNLKKLSINKTYKIKKLKISSFFNNQTIEADTVSFSVFDSKISPLIVASFTNGFEISFADPKLTTDKYDAAAILDEAKDFISPNTYNIKFLKKIIDRIVE